MFLVIIVIEEYPNTERSQASKAKLYNLYKISLSSDETDFCYLDFLWGEKIYLGNISPHTIWQ